MYLKSLEMHGFKSFPDKTKLVFERGATVIVGPNGSGKSNISDAMRWVLGETSSKSLRGTKMEDVIFAGADSRRPMGFAEVSVTFDNTDPENRLDNPNDEVVVTRRRYRAGESEYFINRQPCLLRDIQQLFMNTGVGKDGYSIIGQGKIAEIISRKSDERRSVFEDASGIAKYRHDKTETERKLATTEENMTRVNDIFQEVSAQVGPLEKAAERAKSAIELIEQKKKLDVQLWIYDSDRLRVEAQKAEENFRNSSYDLKIAEEAIDNYQAQSEQLFEDSQNTKAKAAEVLERIRSLTDENHNRDSQYQVAANAIANTKERIEAVKLSIAARQERLTAEEEEGRRRQQTCEELQKRCTELENEHTGKAEEAQEIANRTLTIAGEIAAALADIDERENEAMDIKVRMQVIENGKLTDSDKHSSMESEIAQYRSVSEDLRRQWEAKNKVVEGYTAQITAAEEKIAACDEKLSACNEKLQELLDDENECKVQSNIATQRINAFRAMEENLEGFGHSVRYVMEAYAAGKITDARGNRCGKIYGPLSKLISVDKKYVTAIEIALAANLQHIVVEDEAVAKAASYHLKQAQAGRVTLFPISSMRAQTPTAEMEEAKHCAGYVGVASDLVDCDNKFREIVGSLLGRTVVFDNLDHANDMARKTKFRVKVVTLDGQVINAGGSFVVGSVKQKGGVLSRSSEIESLSEKLKELERRMQELKNERAELEKEIDDLSYERSDADDRRVLLESLRGSEAAVAAQHQAKLDANEALIEKITGDYETLSRQRAGYDEELARLAVREQVLQKEIAEIGQLRTDKDLERNALLDRVDAIKNEMTELHIAISGVRKDIETATTYREESDARAEALREDIRTRTEQIAEMEERVRTDTLRQEANRNTFAEGERVLAELNEQHKALQEAGMVYEQKLAAVNAKIRDKMTEKERISLAHSKNEDKLQKLREEQDNLTAKFQENYDMTRNEALELGYEMLEHGKVQEAREQQISCRNRLRAIGNVDLDAVEKFKEVKERYDYMSGQIADMTAARDDLLKIIKELETQMQVAFMETFEKINTNFDKTFKELFGGGSAELSLSDPTDVLTSGIEIKAAPPGKIIKNMTLLSGGEQSFIAIALFFAILQVNPTPFFIFDEIEAALDEVNVARFAAYIKRYSTDTQFILITHRRGTMEAANRLYGVTMPERGISKVLALDVSSIRGKQEGDDWNGIFG
ncbi:MAG: chromosome segregation protein SMC [Clostridia bacterium]|nr:chromosome segregation protein SMC [Clostridia bacterium]